MCQAGQEGPGEHGHLHSARSRSQSSEALHQESPRKDCQRMPGPGWEKGGWREAQDASLGRGLGARRGRSSPGCEEGDHSPNAWPVDQVSRAPDSAHGSSAPRSPVVSWHPLSLCSTSSSPTSNRAGHVAKGSTGLLDTKFREEHQNKRSVTQRKLNHTALNCQPIRRPGSSQPQQALTTRSWTVSTATRKGNTKAISF